MEFYTAVRVDWQSARESFDAVGIHDGGTGQHHQSSSGGSGNSDTRIQHYSGSGSGNGSVNGSDNGNGSGSGSGSGNDDDTSISPGARRMFALIEHMKNYAADSLRRLAIVECAAFTDAHALGMYSWRMGRLF